MIWSVFCWKKETKTEFAEHFECLPYLFFFLFLYQPQSPPLTPTSLYTSSTSNGSQYPIFSIDQVHYCMSDIKTGKPRVPSFRSLKRGVSSMTGCRCMSAWWTVCLWCGFFDTLHPHLPALCYQWSIRVIVLQSCLLCHSCPWLNRFRIAGSEKTRVIKKVLATCFHYFPIHNHECA